MERDTDIIKTSQEAKGPALSKSTTKARNDLKWQALCPEIHKLYIEEDNSLQKTREVIAEKHKFEASERKWKMKLKEWGYEKYIPFKDMYTLVDKAEKRLRDEGKDTEFFHRGQNIPTDRLEKFKRRNTNQHYRQLESAEDATTPQNITYHTPRPQASTEIDNVFPVIVEGSFSPVIAPDTVYIESSTKGILPISDRASIIEASTQNLPPTVSEEERKLEATGPSCAVAGQAGGGVGRQVGIVTSDVLIELPLQRSATFGTSSDQANVFTLLSVDGLPHKTQSAPEESLLPLVGPGENTDNLKTINNLTGGILDDTLATSVCPRDVLPSRFWPTNSLGGSVSTNSRQNTSRCNQEPSSATGAPGQEKPLPEDETLNIAGLLSGGKENLGRFSEICLIEVILDIAKNLEPVSVTVQMKEYLLELLHRPMPTYSDINQQNQVVRLYDDLHTLVREITGIELLATVHLMCRYACVLSDQGRYTNAKNVYREATDLIAKLKQPMRVQMNFRCQVALGSVLLNQGNLEDSCRTLASCLPYPFNSAGKCLFVRRPLEKGNTAFFPWPQVHQSPESYSYRNVSLALVDLERSIPHPSTEIKRDSASEDLLMLHVLKAAALLLILGFGETRDLRTLLSLFSKAINWKITDLHKIEGYIDVLILCGLWYVCKKQLEKLAWVLLHIHGFLKIISRQRGYEDTLDKMVDLLRSRRRTVKTTMSRETRMPMARDIYDLKVDVYDLETELRAIYQLEYASIRCQGSQELPFHLEDFEVILEAILKFGEGEGWKIRDNGKVLLGNEDDDDDDDHQSRYGTTYSCSTITGVSNSVYMVP